MAKRTATPVSASWKAEAAAEDGPSELTKGEKGLMSKAFGISGLAVGVLSVWWAVAADPAVGGDLAQRQGAGPFAVYSIVVTRHDVFVFAFWWT